MRTHTAEEKYKITLRVNRDLLEEIRAAAARESRTINSYMIHRLVSELMPQHLERKPPAKHK